MTGTTEVRRGIFRRAIVTGRVACIAFLGSAAAIAQTPVANPSMPLYSDGSIFTAATAPDGSTIVGGYFAFIDGVPRANIARILADGSLDLAWNPGADGYVKSIAIDSSGSVYVSGCFSQIGGAPRVAFAKLAGAGEGLADASWNPGANETCGGPILLDSTETALFVSGNFQHVGGQDRNVLAKLATGGAGEADTNWNPAPDADRYAWSPISALARDGSGAIYVAGYFEHIGGQAIGGLAKVSASGSGSADANWNPAPDCHVNSLVIDPSGPLYAGGCFKSIGGQIASGLAKLSTNGNGSASGAWKPNADSDVFTLRLAGNELYVGGSFTQIDNIAVNQVARVSTVGNGKVDVAWHPAVGGGQYPTVYAVAQNGVDRVVIGGEFQTVGGQTRIGLALVDASANILPARNALIPGYVEALLAQPGGGVIVGGAFRFAGTTVRNGLLRLQSDGTLDPDWNPNPNSYVDLLALGADGTIYASGGFSEIGGNSSAGLARMSGSGIGVVDPAWKPSFPYASALAIDASGDVYAAGGFQAPYLVKITADGSVDGTWSPDADSSVSALLVDDASGRLYVGGWFQNIGGGTAPYLARIDLGTGALDWSWLPELTYPAQSLAFGVADEIYVGGYFGVVAGVYANGIVRVSRSTAAIGTDWLPHCLAREFAVDASREVLYATGCFTNVGRVPLASPGKDAEGWGAQLDGITDLTTIAVDATSGNVIVGGIFQSINGVMRVSLAGLPPTVPPLAASERTWLHDLYTNAGGPQWIVATGWNGAPGAECTWFGVQCLNGHVFSLDLPFNGLSGEIPDFSGLADINEIVLAGNALTGSIPPLDSLSNLTNFNVYHNQLTGSIPPLATLSNLRHFSVSENQLTGSIPAIDGLMHLWQFVARDNALSGPIPNLGSALYWFDVASNALTGPIPALSGAQMISVFDVSHNLLTGVVPYLGANQQLADFNASYNELSGSVPGGHPNLGTLNLGHNQLTGSIPAFENFPFLYNLALDHNQLTGSIPALTQSIGVFDVSGNSLVGNLPQLAALPYLSDFYASGNQLTGPIPAFPPQLLSFDASSNNLSGEIQLSENSNLYLYNVSDNALVGSIPPLTGRPMLSVFAVTNNQLSGFLPSLRTTKLNVFMAGGNRLSGTIPPLPVSMLTFIANDNQLTGGLPDLSGLPNLNEFDVSTNQISGTIANFAPANTLQRFAVASNQLTGSIPSLQPLQYIRSIDVSHNHLSGQIPYLWVVPFLQDFFAASNDLTGPVPTLNSNYYLQYFSASDNQLDGLLPYFIDRPMLQFFDVARNRLTGQIPDLSGLPGVKYFRVGSNRLIGAVPVAPPSLVANGSSLCANLLDTTPGANDAAWNVATGTGPSAWWMTPYDNNRCDDIFTSGF